MLSDRSGEELYSREEVFQIFQGYRMLNADGALASLLARAARCRCCTERYPERSDLPFNLLVRPLPLDGLGSPAAAADYWTRLRRDRGVWEKGIRQEIAPKELVDRDPSARFSIGLLPWLDRCMLHRKSHHTELMVVGIDFKHLGLFLEYGRDGLLPLDSYRKLCDIWGPSWQNFWSELLGRPYDDSKVDRFLAEHGVYFTNSQLCFGGAADPNQHFEGYLECCRPHIEDQIRLVQPEVLVSFGVLGCRNVARILLDDNPGHRHLEQLTSGEPLSGLMGSIAAEVGDDGIAVRLAGKALRFWPLFQPAWIGVNRYPGDYDVLRKMLDLPEV